MSAANTHPAAQEEAQATYIIQHRMRTIINNDPLNRVYNGCVKDPQEVWTAWGELEGGFTTMEAAEKRLAFWQSLNDYAVQERGHGARREFRAILSSELQR